MVLRLLGLNHNGPTLLTPRAASSLKWGGSVVLVQCLIELFAFTIAFAYAFPWPIAMGLAFCYAWLNLNMDRGYLVADFSSKSGKKAGLANVGRYLIMFGFPLVTAIPFELAWFHDEIGIEITQTEIDAQDKMRKDALGKLTIEWYGDDTATEPDLKVGKFGVIEREAETAFQQDTANAEKDLAEHKAESEAKRLELQAEAQKRKQCADCELTGSCAQVIGCVGSRKYGDGPAWQKKQEAADKAQALYQAHLDKTTAKTERLQGERDAKLTAARDKKQKTLDDARNLYKAEQKHIKTMDPEVMRTELPGDWKQSRGFLARLAVLWEMRNDPVHGTAVVFMAYVLHGIMLCFPIGIQVIKYLMPKEPDAYYSLVGQARAGNPDAIQVLEALSDDELEAMGVSRAEFDLPARHRQLHQELMGALTAHRERKQELIVRDDKGLFPTREKIHVQLQRHWVDTVIPTVMALLELQQVAKKQKNDELLAWPGWQPLQDMREKNEPWNLNQEEFDRHGWVDPKPLIQAADQALEDVPDVIADLRRIVHVLFPDEVRHEVSDNTEASLGEIQRALHPWFQQHVADRIQQMDEHHHAIQRGGRQVPSWPQDLPSLDELRILWRISPRTASQEGWTGPQTLSELPDLRPVVTAPEPPITTNPTPEPEPTRDPRVTSPLPAPPPEEIDDTDENDDAPEPSPSPFAGADDEELAAAIEKGLGPDDAPDDILDDPEVGNEPDLDFLKDVEPSAHAAESLVPESDPPVPIPAPDARTTQVMGSGLLGTPAAGTDDDASEPVTDGEDVSDADDANEEPEAGDATGTPDENV